MSAPLHATGPIGVIGAPSELMSGTAVRGSTAVTRLDLTDFRNYAHLRLAIDARPVVLTGLNGAGKTNLLEALSLLAPGSGLRRARIADISRRDGDDRDGSGRAWAVAARLTTPHGETSFGIGRAARDGSSEGDRRIVQIDGAPAHSQSALADRCAVVWLTPEMDRLFADSGSARRRFLDRLVFGSDPAHAPRVAAYEHALRERARALRSGVSDAAWLTALEDTMSTKGIEIAAARQHTIDRLNGVADGWAPLFPRLRLAMLGAVDEWLSDTSADAAVARLRTALAASRSRDREAGGALHGAHRSDWRAHNLDKDAPAAQCSTGEQKAILVCIVLAYAKLLSDQTGATPILLLDAVAAHLDQRRRASLYAALCDFGAQAWLTGTERGLFNGLGGRAQFFTVANGEVAQTATESG